MNSKLLVSLSLTIGLLVFSALSCYGQPQGAPAGGFGGGAPAGGFGGFQMNNDKLHFSQKFSDINYAGDGKEYHNLDIYLPEKVKDSYPVVVHIYGSAWFSNNSKGMADLNTIVAALLDAGYAVVTPNHRSSTDAKFPAQINDIKAVIRFVRGEAAKYKFDTSFVAISGFSSGGHLSSLAAMSNGVKVQTFGDSSCDIEGNIGNYLDQSSRVNAACDWSGPVDLLHMDCGDSMKMTPSPEEQVVGVPLKGNEDRYRLLSPVYYVDPSDVPIYLFHGKQDNVVPCCQSENFYSTLQAAKVRSYLLLEPEGGHGINMYSDANLKKMVDFLDSVRTSR